MMAKADEALAKVGRASRSYLWVHLTCGCVGL